MSLILNIDTALSRASVCLSSNAVPVGYTENKFQQGHAAWLHPAIDEMLKKNGYTFQQLNAVSVSIGPGSYTGLRVGLSSAKGICYAMNIPLITIATTELIAYAVQQEATDLICPVIDARRMEIFTAIYHADLRVFKTPYSLIVEKDSFNGYFAEHDILFCGDGCQKLQGLIIHNRARFSSTIADASHLAAIATKRFINNDFADLAYTEPLYIKDFFSPERKK